MAKLSILGGATSKSVNIFIQDSSKTTGAGLTGLAFNTSGLTAYYSFAGANATATAITLATLAAVNSAYSSGGFKEISSANMPGLYRLDLPNAVVAAASGQSVVVLLQGAANMVPCILEIELTSVDNQNAVNYGLSALPNATAAASGGLLINGSNTGTVTISDGLVVNRSTTNASAIVATGNGSGSGISGTLSDLSVSTYAESSAVPAATSTLKDRIVWLGTLARNKITQNSTTETLFANDGVTPVSTSADSDDGTTFTRGKWS